MKALRLALAGAGVIGRAHAERMRSQAQCVLAGVADPTPEAAAFAQAMGVPHFTTLNALLEATQPDGAILATPNALHVPGALACLARRVPVLVEKPIADTLDEAHVLVAAAATSGVPVLVGHHRRHSALLQAARAVIESGQLGRLVSVNGSATFRKPDSYFTEAPWRAQPGGGPILINLVHEIDNLRMLLGEIVEVQALASNAARGGAVEDTVAISLRFANGVLGSFLLSDSAASPRSWEQTSGENTRYDRHTDEDCYVIAGDAGSLEVPTMRLRRYAGERSWWEPLVTETLAVPALDPLQRQLDHFCAVIRGEETPLVSAADAARTLEVTLAVGRAAASHQALRLAA
ncbi:MAG TPA: Gfo/Idh/MocA family oxidoreductase [Rhizobacter sp.]|nr:Gfo/Idh/MocA family oxidoreductase [Rhizobacter sp.]